MPDYIEKSGPVEEIRKWSVVIGGEEMKYSRSYKKERFGEAHLGKNATVKADRYNGALYIVEVISPEMGEAEGKSAASSPKGRSFGRMSPEELAFKERERGQINRHNAVNLAIQARQAKVKIDADFLGQVKAIHAFISEGSVEIPPAAANKPSGGRKKKETDEEKPVKATQTEEDGKPPKKEKGGKSSKARVESKTVNELWQDVKKQGLSWKEFQEVSKRKFGKSPYFLDPDTFKVFSDVILAAIERAA